MTRLTDDDLKGYAKHIAHNARSALEARDNAWVYLPSFADEVTAQAFAMLKAVVQHERKEANMSNEKPEDKPDVFFHAMPNPDACEHDFQGWRDFKDGSGGETICTKCGIGAMAYSLRCGF